MTPDVLELARTVTQLLEQAGFDVVVGGSVASSVVGEPRATVDIDVAIDPVDDTTPRLLGAFADGYYISETAVAEAVSRRGSFNVIHLDSMQKVDVFILGDGALDRAQFHLGGETSERQWRDVIAILRVQQGRLDEAHMDRVAASEGIAGLLSRARADAGPRRPEGEPRDATSRICSWVGGPVADAQHG